MKASKGVLKSYLHIVLPLLVLFGCTQVFADATISDTYIGTITGTVTIYTVTKYQTTDYVYTTLGVPTTSETIIASTYVTTVSPSLIVPPTSSIFSPSPTSASNPSLSTSYTTSQITGVDGTITPVALEYVYTIKYVDGCFPPTSALYSSA